MTNKNPKSARRGPAAPGDTTFASILANVRARAAEAAANGEDLRITGKADWGIDPAFLNLPTSAEVASTQDLDGKRTVFAKRATVFELVTLSPAQAGASRRYQVDHAVAAGVSPSVIDEPLDDEIPGRAPSADAAPGLAPGQLVTQRMVDAGARIAEAHRLAGPGSARLLNGLVEPMMRGEVRPWREEVTKLTGETERHAQAAVVRQACENLALAYDTIDEDKARRRRFAGGSAAA